MITSFLQMDHSRCVFVETRHRFVYHRSQAVVSSVRSSPHDAVFFETPFLAIENPAETNGRLFATNGWLFVTNGFLFVTNGWLFATNGFLFATNGFLFATNG